MERELFPISMQLYLISRYPKGYLEIVVPWTIFLFFYSLFFFKYLAIFFFLTVQ